MKSYRLFLIFAIIAGTSISCNRTKDLSFSDFDKDDSSLIEQDEFVEVFTDNFYNDWDDQDDPYLDDEDFYKATFRVWDDDRNEFIDKEEWIIGYDYHYGDYVVVEFEDIDVDNDGYITYDEYHATIEKTELYEDWDFNDNMEISQTELARNIFDRWDINQSGFIEEDEFNEFDMYYLDI